MTGPAQIAVSTVCFGDQWSTDDIAAAARHAGFSGLELTRERVNEAATCLAEHSQVPVTVGPLQNFAGGAAHHVQARQSEALALLGQAEHIGAQAILTCLPMEMITDPDMAVAQLRWLADAIERRTRPGKPGPEVWLEALCWGPDFNRVQHAWQIVQATGLHRVKLVIDTYHFFARGGELRHLEMISPACIGLVQICDSPQEPLDAADAKRLARDFRLPPGDGVWARQIESLLAWLYRHGYDGWLSLEVFNAASRDVPPEELAGKLMTATLRSGAWL